MGFVSRVLQCCDSALLLSHQDKTAQLRNIMSDTKWSDWIDWNAKQDSESPIPDGTLSQVAFHNQDSIPDVSPEKWDWFRCKDPIFAYRYVLADMDVWTKPLPSGSI